MKRELNLVEVGAIVVDSNGSIKVGGIVISSSELGRINRYATDAPTVTENLLGSKTAGKAVVNLVNGIRRIDVAHISA